VVVKLLEKRDDLDEKYGQISVGVLLVQDLVVVLGAEALHLKPELGAFLAGIADQILAVDRTTVLLIESVLTVTGFGVITYSLYVE